MRPLFKNCLLTLAFLVLCGLSLVGQPRGPFPTANFQLSQTMGCVPLSISISNLSVQSSSYEWDLGNGVTSLATNPVVVYTTAGSYDIRLIARDTLGNADTLIMNNAVQVNALPNVNFSFQILDSCAKTNQVNFFNHANIQDTVLWCFGDGTFANTIDATHSYALSGSYVPFLRIADSIGCASIHQSSSPIQIIQGSIADFTVNDTLACNASKSFQFTYNGSNAVSWYWDFGDGLTSTATHPTHQYANPGKYDVTLITTCAQACSDTIIKEDFIHILSADLIDFNGDTLSACVPFNSVLYPLNKDTNVTYWWKIEGDPTLIHGDTVRVKFENPASLDVTLYRQNQNGCIDSIVKNDFINALGLADAYFTFDTTALCKGNAIQFNDLSVNTQSTSWHFGDSVINNTSNPIFTYSKNGIHTISLTAVDNLGCSDTHVDSISINSPDLRVSVLDSVGCIPFAVDFISLANDAQYWFWDFGDGDTSHQRNPNHLYQSSGLFDVFFVVENGSNCRDSMLYSNLIRVIDDTVHEAMGDTIKGCLPLAVDLSANRIGSNNWLWEFGNGDTSNLKNPQYTYTEAGNYVISLTTFNSEGCPIHYSNYATVSIDSITPKLSVLFFDCNKGVVQLTDSTEGIINWLWDFGDGTFSTLQSPVHKYNDTLKYDISLTLFTSDGCVHSVFFPAYLDFSTCTVAGLPMSYTGAPLPRADSSMRLDSNVIIAQRCASQVVAFQNPIAGSTSWLWDFGDGGNSSNSDPVHIYQSPGVYDVSVIAQTSTGPDTVYWPGYVTVNGPVADFSTQVNDNCDSVQLVIQDSSLSATQWDWDFGSLGNSQLQNPVLMIPYSSRNYVVQLYVTDSMGCTSSKVSLFNFSRSRENFFFPDTICLGDTAFFSVQDTSLYCIWDYGDGTIDTSHSPMHVYPFSGKYGLKVITISALGCRDTVQLDSILVKGIDAGFTIHDSIGCIRSRFKATPIQLDADSYEWIFGTDTIRHKYLNTRQINSGSYQVSLKVIKDGCQRSWSDTTAIQILDVDADFTIQQLNSCHPVQISVQDSNVNSVNWNWTLNGISVDSSKRDIHLSLTDSSIIGLRIVAMNGCADSVEKTFVPDVLSSDFAISDSVGCAPFQVDFTNLSNRSQRSYWSFGDGDTSMSKDPSHIYTDTGLYTVRLISESIDGCFDTIEYVNLIRSSSINVAYTVSTQDLCTPILAQFNDQSNGAVKWKWNLGDSSISNVANPIQIYNHPGEYDVKLVVENQFGCLDSISDTARIIVPGPISMFSVSDALLCDTLPVYFFDSSMNAVSWQWFFGDGNTSTAQNPSHIYQQAGNYAITLMAADSNGCSASYTNPQQIRYSPKPITEFTLSHLSGCSPLTVDVQTNFIDSANTIWIIDGQQITTSVLTSWTFEEAGFHSIQLIRENLSGCRDSMIVDSIEVLPSYDPSIANLEMLFCDNTPQFQLQAAYPGGIWQAKGIVDSVNGYYSPIQNGIGLDTIYYKLGGLCPTADTLTINVKAAPKIDFISDKLEDCNSLVSNLQTIDLDANASKIEWSYLWMANQDTISRLENPIHTFGPGNYDIKLIVSDTNGCSSSLNKTSYINVFDSIPIQSNLTRVSVQGFSEVFVEWDAITDESFAYYEIFRRNDLNTSYVLIDTIHDPSQRIYLDKGLDTPRRIYCYKVLAVDKCELRKELSLEKEHCTIRLTTDPVSRTRVELKWSAYVGENIDEYQVFRFDVETQTRLLMASLSPTTLQFSDTAAFCNYQYKYQIRAIGKNALSSGSASNPSIEQMNGIADLHKTNIINATVEDNRNVRVNWEPLAVAKEFATGYVVYRSNDKQNYEPLIFMPLDANSYLDTDVQVEEESYYYMVEVINTCRQKNEVDNEASSIHLKGEQFDDYNGVLRWSPYEKWEDGIDRYEIQRLNEQNQWETIKVLPDSSRVFRVNF